MNEIANGVHQVSQGYVNAFLVDGDEGVVIIDTGLPKKEGKIETALTSIGRSPADVIAIMLTHSHADHSGGAAALKESMDAPLMTSERAARAVRGEVKPPPPPIMDGILRPLANLMPSPPSTDVDQIVGEGTRNLPADFDVLSTPGHTPGHICYLLDRDGGILFVGDAAVSTKDGRVSRGWMNKRSPDWDASITNISGNEFSRAFFGHAGPITSGAADAFRSFAATL